MFIDLFTKIINAIKPSKKAKGAENCSEPASNVSEPWSQPEEMQQDSPELQQSCTTSQQEEWPNP